MTHHKADRTIQQIHINFIMKAPQPFFSTEENPCNNLPYIWEKVDFFFFFFGENISSIINKEIEDFGITIILSQITV